MGIIPPTMRVMLCLVLWPVFLLSARGAEDEVTVSPPRAKDDPRYQKALAEELRLNPPGDYAERPVRQFAGSPRHMVTAEQVVEMVLAPVERPNTDVPTLFAEAAKLHREGRTDLATVRYKQVLLIEPENIKAKANLYDIITIWCLSQAGSLQREINKYHEALTKRTEADLIAARDVKPHLPGDDHKPSVQPSSDEATNGSERTTGALAANNESPITAEQVVALVLKSVKKPNKDAASLLSEAAEFWAAGRIDLAAMRYKEVLMVEPENIKAKAALYDYTVMKCLKQTGVPWLEIKPRLEAMQKRTAVDIIAPKEKTE